MPSPRVLSSARGDWQTPPEIVDLIEGFNGGPIDLDPCTVETNPTRAKEIWVLPAADGLDQPWPYGKLVFCNPPFSDMRKWAAKAAQEGRPPVGSEIILLAVPRTDTAWFRDVWTADALAFWYGSGDKGCPRRSSRLRFIEPSTGEPVPGNTSPSVFAYWGRRSMRFARTFEPYARVIFP